MTQNSHKDYLSGGKQPSGYGKETVLYMRKSSHYHWHSCAAQSEIRVEVETRPRRLSLRSLLGSTHDHTSWAWDPCWGRDTTTPVEICVEVDIDQSRSLLESIHDYTSWDVRWGRYTTTPGPHVMCGLEYSAMVGAIYITVYGWGRHTTTPVVHVVCGNEVSHNGEGNTYCNICWGRRPTTPPDPHVVCRLEHRTTVRAIHIAGAITM